ncbi:MAG: PTS sugar transporter subunit IIA [Myxococcales bacterium]
MQLTVKEAAKFLDVPERQIFAWIDGGEIPFSRGHGGIRFNETELLEWATGRRLRASHELVSASAHAQDGPSLADALALGGIHHGLSAPDRDAAIRAVVERMPLGAEADRETLIEIMLAREAAGSTAVGDGIAIPHVRAPVVQSGARPAIALCTLARPIDFGARDQKPVHTLFVLLTPSVGAHLQMLARLAAALHDEGFKAAVLRRAPAEDILAEARRLDAAAKAGR